MTTRRSLLSLALTSALAPPLIRDARAADVDMFPLGVASGTPSPNGFVLWTRVVGVKLPDQLQVRWEVARDESFSDVAAHGSEHAEKAWAHSVHVEVNGLVPSRSYWYRFTALGSRSQIGRTRTLPASSSSEPLRLAIASCQCWEHGHYAAWRHMADENLDLVLFLGDYIYEFGPTLRDARRVRTHSGTGPAMTLQHYRDRHAQYKSDPALQAMHAAAPWIMTWDDHEVENDYANLQSPSLEPNFVQRRAHAYQAYWEHMPFPRALRPRGAHMRIHARYDWGDLARIHTIDNRQYRDVQACPRRGRRGSNAVLPRDCPDLLDPERSLLGFAQERWLKEGWSTQHGWNLLAQQTLMAHMRRHYAYGTGSRHAMIQTDGWDGYAVARNRLLGDIAHRKIDNVVVLGGDMHANYVADLKIDQDDDNSTVVASEFCGTSISSRSKLPQSRLDALLPVNPSFHYAHSDQRGYVSFLLERKVLSAKLRVVDNPLDAASEIRTAASFVVEARNPGVQAA